MAVHGKGQKDVREALPGLAKQNMGLFKAKASLETSKLTYLSPQQFLKLCGASGLFIVTGKYCPKIPP